MPLKEEDGFSLDDVMEIFGDQKAAASSRPAEKPAAPPPPAEAAKPVAAPAAAPAPVAAEDGISDEELRQLEAYEAKKRARLEKEAEAKHQKELEEQRILEEYERKKKEAADREAAERRAREEKQKAELEGLKQKELQEEMRRKEEQRIIEEYEREQRERQTREKAEEEAREAKAQEQLKQLAARQQAEAQKRQEEAQAEARKAEESLKEQAAAGSGDKQKRLLELLGKVQAEISQAPAGLAPLPKIEERPAALPPLPSAPSRAETHAPAAHIGLPQDVSSDLSDAMAYMLEESRKTTFNFLAPIIGIKAANSMLAKTVEKARAKAPAMLKDVNWKLDGTLREDGSLDTDRLFKNAATVPQAQRTDLFFKAMHELVGLRLQAIEMGLGAKSKAELLDKLLGMKLRFIDKGVLEPWVLLFFQEVVPH